MNINDNTVYIKTITLNQNSLKISLEIKPWKLKKQFLHSLTKII